MTKQEEIQRGIESLIPMNYMTSSVQQSKRIYANKILSYLHSQGVVIKVDRDACCLMTCGSCGKTLTQIPSRILRDAGYVATEPLIKETKDE